MDGTKAGMADQIATLQAERDRLAGELATKVFVVEMLRWGDAENHSYVHGVYSTREAAEKAGQVQAVWRGGKYDPRITECEIDPRNKEEVSAEEYYQSCLPTPPTDTDVGADNG